MGSTEGRPRRWRRWLLLLIPLVFLGIPLVRYLGAGEETAVERAAPVVVGRPQRGNLDVVLRYAGTLKPQMTTTVVPKVSGRVEAVLVTEGQAVREGQVLVVIDDEVVRIQAEQARSAWEAAQAQLEKAQSGARPEEVESARASLEQAEKDLQTAQSAFERTRTLYEAGTVTRSRFEEAENALKSGGTELENARRTVRLLEQGARTEDLAMARANADAARSQYELARLQEQYTRVQAPITGSVARVLVERGHMVALGTPLLAIVNSSLTFAHIEVPEQHYGRITTYAGNLTAWVRPIAYPDHAPFPGVVTNIGATLDPTSRTFTVEVAVTNGEGLLRPGMYVNTEIVLERRQDALLVPSSAVLYRDDRYVVFVVEGDGVARMRTVEPGVSQDEVTQILSGTDETDAVVLKGNAFLEDGQRVSAVEP